MLSRMYSPKPHFETNQFQFGILGAPQDGFIEFTQQAHATITLAPSHCSFDSFLSKNRIGVAHLPKDWAGKALGEPCVRLG
jgi:hypothetical protein